MGMKAECDGCGRQVDNRPDQTNGWITVSTIEHYPIYEPTLNGIFCMPMCIVAKMKEQEQFIPDTVEETT